MRLFALGAVFCFFASLSVAHAKADPAELNRIPLIRTDTYDPRQEQGREFSQFTSSIGISLFGGLYASTALDLKKEIYEKFSAPEIRAYFPSEKERREIAARIDSQVRSRFLSKGLSNETANAAIRYAASDLAGTIVRRVLQSEGIKDPERRGLWANRLLIPFHGCMREARTYKEGMRCMEAFQADAIQNIGLAMSHEMVRQEMGADYAKTSPDSYRRCLKAGQKGASSRVKACVAASVGEAAFGFGQAKLRGVAEAQVPGRGAAVAARTAPAFKACLAKASTKKGFTACADALTTAGGAEIASEAILANAQVKETFPNEKARKPVAEAGRKEFLACAAAAKAAGKRDESGTLQLEPCAHGVRMEAARRVALEVLRVNIEQTAGAPVAEVARMQKEVAASLASCWKSTAPEEKNSDCLKTAVRKLVATLASYKLDQELPARLLTKAPNIKADLLRTADQCLQEKLKGNLLEGGDVVGNVKSCGGPLLREAALKIASFQMGEVIQGKSQDPELPRRLENKFVQEKFGGCLGPSPDDQTLARCSLDLRRDAGREVAVALFGEQMDKFLESGGGLKAYGLGEDDKKAFLEELLKGHEQCLKSDVKGTNAQAEAGLDACFKSSIEKLASFLAGLEFRRQVQQHMPDAKNLPKFTDDFLGEFRACLAEKRPAKFPVADYVTNIDACRLRLTKKYTLEMGRRQLAAAFDENLPDEVEGTPEKKRAFVESLTTRFEKCLDKVKPEDYGGREACAADLKHEATRTLVIAATRAQGKKLLNTGELPPAAISALETQYEVCLKKSRDADVCAKNHVQESAKAVAHLKLHHTMADMLGDDYRRFLPTLEKLEADYRACVDVLPIVKISEAYVKAMEACAKDLEDRGVDFSQRYLRDKMVNRRMGEQEKALLLSAAEVVPCLNVLAVPKPFDENFLERFDPEGTFDILAKLAGDYINYDAEKAGDDYEAVLRQLVDDLRAAGPKEARRKLLDALIKRGMVDQLLKSMIRAEIKRALAELPASDRLPDQVVQALLNKDLLDKVMSPELMAKFRPFMAERLLGPVLLEGKSMKAAPQAAAIGTLKSQIADALLASKDFGDLLVASAVQKQIDNKAEWAVTKWLATKFMGYRSLYWKDVRETEKGRKAEEFVRSQVVRPQFTGESVSAEEKARRLAEANRLVEEALK